MHGKSGGRDLGIVLSVLVKFPMFSVILVLVTCIVLVICVRWFGRRGQTEADSRPEGYEEITPPPGAGDIGEGKSMGYNTLRNYQDNLYGGSRSPGSLGDRLSPSAAFEDRLSQSSFGDRLSPSFIVDRHNSSPN